MGQSEVPSQRIGIIGAGIVGISCALFLQRDGHSVRIIDSQLPGQGASFGNAGIIAISCTPEATPGVLLRIPSMLMNPTSPLAIRWRYVPHLLPWLWRFIQSAQPNRVEKISVALASLSSRAREAYDVLLKQTNATNLVRSDGWLKVFRTEKAFKQSLTEQELMSRRGLSIDVLNSEHIRQLEPALAPIFPRGLLLRDSAFVPNPGRLIETFTSDFLDRGGKLQQETALKLEPTKTTHRVVTDRSTYDFDVIILCAGAWSASLARQLKISVPLDTERGYHLALPLPNQNLKRPVLIADHYFVLAPMDDCLRLTSAAEMAGLEAPPDFTLPHRLLPLAKEALPSLVPTVRDSWIGFRPSMPDSTPVIGQATGTSGVYFAFGHGHLGLTHGPITGRIIADLIANRDPGLNMSPFRVDR